MILEQIPEISKLNKQEKLTLVGELWDEIIQQDYPEITEEEKELLDKRYMNYKDNPRRGSTWQEVKKKLDKQ